MGKKTVTKHAASGKEFWDSQGWRPVDVGDDLLLGADEYGFCGLEELDGSHLGAPAERGVPQAPALARPCHSPSFSFLLMQAAWSRLLGPTMPKGRKEARLRRIRSSQGARRRARSASSQRLAAAAKPPLSWQHPSTGLRSWSE